VKKSQLKQKHTYLNQMKAGFASIETNLDITNKNIIMSQTLYSLKEGVIRL